jgi:hypothetical protein
MTTKFITESGSMYLLEGTSLTRLAEHPMHDGRDQPLDTQLVAAEIEGWFQPPTVGVPFTARVLGKPLVTTPVAMITG